MPSQVVTETVNVDGTGGFTRTFTITSAAKIVASPIAGVPAALSGTLTTRTSATAGIITFGSTTAYTTSTVPDLFWSGGSVRGATISAVSGATITFSISGATLPALGSVITTNIPVVESFVFTGSNAKSALVSSNLMSNDGNAYIVFQTSVPADVAIFDLSGALPSFSFDGTTVNGNAQSANPFSGQSVAQVTFSHGATSVKTMTAAVLYT